MIRMHITTPTRQDQMRVGHPCATPHALDMRRFDLWNDRAIIERLAQTRGFENARSGNSGYTNKPHIGISLCIVVPLLDDRATIISG